ILGTRIAADAAHHVPDVVAAEHAVAVAAAAAAAHGYDTHGDAHAHGAVPHESPKSMTYVLIALAAAAVLAGFVFGWPSAWGGHEPLLEQWLAPSLPAAELVPFAHASHSTELLFQLIGGVVVAGGGFVFAYLLYNDNKSSIPARLKATFPRAWGLVYNKYYVDELYQVTIVRGALLFSRAMYWVDQNLIDGLVNLMGLLGRSVAYVDAGIDKYIVDGAVNGLASLTWNSGRAL